MITPELPRAPISAPKLMAAATRSAGWPADALGFLESGLDRGQHVRARVPVRDREDVQRVDLVDVGLEVRHGRPERREQARRRRTRDGPSGDVGPAVG